jgi:hypothetical protein
LAVADATYRFRGSLGAGEQSYAVTEDALTWPGGTVPLDRIAAISIYAVPGMRMLGYGTVAQPSRRCTIRLRDGRKIVLSSLHFLGLGRFEDRTQSYLPFMRTLISNVAARHPDVRLTTGMPSPLWWLWLMTFGLLVLVLGIILLGVLIGVLSGSLPWTSIGFLLAVAALGIGPGLYVRGLLQRRQRPLDPTAYEL